MTEVRSPHRKLVPDAVGPERHETTSLRGIAKRARACKDHRFQDLYRLLDAELLLESWGALNKHAASGVDRVSAQAYEEDLHANIDRLVERLKTKRYRARLVRRCYIPKDNGQQRPLGIPVLEDKLVQCACAKVLGAIYEADFLPVSYGYRPGRSARDAVGDLGFNLQFGRYGHVVEADIRGFFEHIDHDWLLQMLALRIDDKAFLSLIRQWLKAGILDIDGQVLAPQSGTPQGGVVSPVLANVYLHYALDLWFEKVVKARCQGQALLIRYADDFVCAFQYRREATRLLRELPDRLAKFGLSVAAEKTGMVRFSRFHPGLRRRFAFLGFELYWARDRRGELRVMKRTARKRLQQAKWQMKAWLRASRHQPAPQFFETLNRKLVGHYGYFGLRSNEASIKSFHQFTVACAFKWLNRRGGKRRSYNWATFKAALRQYGVALPRAVERKQQHAVFA